MARLAWLSKLAPKGRGLCPNASGYHVAALRHPRKALLNVALTEVEAVKAQNWLTPLKGTEFYVLSNEGRAQLEERQAQKTQMVTIINSEGVWQKAHKALNTGVLSRYYDPTDESSLITREAYEAAERLHGDYHASILSPRITQNWDQLQTGRGQGQGQARSYDPPTSKVMAKERVFKALEAVGPKLDQVLIAMVIRELSLEGCERHLSWPKRSARFALPLALERLALHYGLIPPRRTAWTL